MSIGISVKGTGIVCAAGDTPAKVFDHLLAKQCLPQPMEVDDHKIPAFPYLNFEPGDFLGDANFRPVDRTGLMSICAARAALIAGGVQLNDEDLEEEIGLCLGTLVSGLDTITAFDHIIANKGPRYVKPLDFANTVINAATGQTALWLKLRGLNATVAGGAASGLQAVIYASDQIRLGRAGKLVAGGVEELGHETVAALHRAGLLADQVTAGQPFAADRKGFLPAEGSAFLLLEGETSLSQDRVRIRGYGEGFAPHRDWLDHQPVRTVMEKAVAESGISVQDLDAVFCSANGSLLADAAEAHALNDLLGEADVPVCAVKRYLGDGLGAAGAITAVIAHEAMLRGIIPPGGAGEHPDPQLSTARLVEEAVERKLKHVLVTALSYDGTAAAMVLSRG